MTNEISKASIQLALDEGHITSKEAEHMSKVYLSTPKPTSITQAKLKNHISA